MRTISIPDDKLREVLAALEHSGASTHHPHCAIRRQRDCTCHVAKANAGYNTLRQAARRIPFRAQYLREGQWLYIEGALPMRIVSLQRATLERVDVRVDSGDDAGGHAETLTFGKDEEVFVLDSTI